MQRKRIGCCYAVVFAMFLSGVSLFGQGNSDNVRGLNGRVLQLQASLRRASAAERARLQSEAAPVFGQRAAALAALIRQDPGAALGIAFSQELRDALAADFPDSAQDLEQHGTWSGTSDHLIFDDPDSQIRRFQVRIRSGADSADVYSAGGEPHCVSGQTLTVEGVRLGGAIAAGSTNVQTTAAASLSCSTTGTQNAAIILVQFRGVPLPTSVTPAGVYDIFFSPSGRSVRNYWEEASYGKASATGAVFGPYTLDRIYSCDESSAMRSAAIAAADADVDFRNYTRIFIVFPNPGTCSWAGLGSLGCSTLSSADGSFTASTSWLLATYMGSRDNGVKLATHEGGHNLTLHHSSSRDFGTEILGPVGAAGTLSEYGDPNSTMGYWNFGHYAAPHKQRMGWLTGSNVEVVESNAGRTILPYETPTGGLQALKVRRGTGNDAWLWLEYRQNPGQYDSTLNTQLFNGALVHYEDSTTGTHTHLLDFTKSTTSYGDAALTGTWADTYSNVSVSVTGASPTGLSLNVFYGPVPCVRAQPTITASPANPSVYSGSGVNYTISVLNNDSSGCAATTFNMNGTVQAGWSALFSPASLVLNPAQSGTATMTVNVPALFTPGTYAVRATTTAAEHADTFADANCTVTTPPEPILASVAVSSTNVSVRSNVTITATVVKQNGGAPVPNASVAFKILRPGGTATATVMTNASGIAQWVYKAQQKGTHSVTATASAGGATVTSGSVTFTAK